MNHPFIKNTHLLYIYSTIWILIAGIHFALLRIFNVESYSLAALDSLVFNLLFFVMGFSLWYPMEFSKIKDQKIFNSIINHLTFVVFIGFIWLGLSYNILSFLTTENASYQSFLYNSLFFRGVIGVFYYTNIVLIYYMLSYYRNLQEKISTEAKLQELLKEAELNFLKAQINPHFLFNSLNSISSLTITEPVKAQEMIIKLSDFLRYVISQTENKPTPLNKELDNIQRYLEIEKIRFGDKLNFVFNCHQDTFNRLIPVLLLQPLYENAIKHGVYESIDPITINTSISLENDFLKIIIGNNYEHYTASHKGAGIGLKNIRERLKLIYQNPELLKINKTDTYFEVQLLIPQFKI